MKKTEKVKGGKRCGNSETNKILFLAYFKFHLLFIYSDKILHATRCIRKPNQISMEKYA